ncbi:MAG: Zn-ribbon domain-containing OB-fold protein [Firmicutes bacterium]|nr:Zn-ribbon domain-containing OB-fold protein [Bacillota bacterium]
MSEPVVLSGEIRIPYNWSAGLAGTRFFTELRDNRRIMGTRCPRCGRVMVPPRIFCEECFVDATEWVEVGSRGTLVTFGESYLSTDGKRLDKPWTLGIVRLEGSDGGLVHLIGEASPEELRIGMPVEAVFAEERRGTILDIKYFRPVRE